ncbi:MAG TPA: hypothetical protein VHG70_01155 [Nocardioidaceae bacterium]|nr:hypothetical protein [Nocardioidaceae bacterium]
MENLNVAVSAAQLDTHPVGHHTHDRAGHDHTLTRWRAVRRFGLHYLEMVVAMAVGMVALAPLWSWAGDALGWTAVLERHDVGSMVMATNMTVAMGAWMKFRGHTWRPIVEMGAAMFLPFAVLLVPLWMGLIGHGFLMTAGHLLMLVGMVVAMLLRPDEYIHHHH